MNTIVLNPNILIFPHLGTHIFLRNSPLHLSMKFRPSHLFYEALIPDYHISQTISSLRPLHLSMNLSSQTSSETYLARKIQFSALRQIFLTTRTIFYKPHQKTFLTKEFDNNFSTTNLLYFNIKNFIPNLHSRNYHIGIFPFIIEHLIIITNFST